MNKQKQFLMWIVLSLFVCAFTAKTAQAKSGDEYKAIVTHLKTKYRAKKVKIPFMWLARFAVGVVRPAGVKSFSVTLFQDLQFSRESLDVEMQRAMRTSFNADWSPIFHIRSRTGQQVYMYMRQAENSDNFRIALVLIDNTQATLIRATFSPEKLAEFINNPTVLGISLNDDKREDKGKLQIQENKIVSESKEK